MNTRCYRCGWSFSLSREAIEEAAVSSAGQKAHVIHCPRCRQAIRIPMDQIMRDLPPGWTPPAPSGEQASAVPEGAASGPADAASQAPEPATAEASQQAQRRSERRHRHSGKTNTGDSAAVPAAKKSTHPT